MLKTKLSLLILMFLMLIVGCSNKQTTPDNLTDKLFALNNDTAIIDVLFGTVEEINAKTADFWGSKRNTENSAVNDILNELQNLEYVKEKPKVPRQYYLLVFNGQLMEDKSDTFEIYLYVNPDNYNLYLDKIQLGDDQPTVEYNRLYQPNDKIKQYVDDIFEVNQ